MKTTCLALGLSVLLTACASGPPTRIFLLAAPAETDGLQTANGAPIQLQTVLIPDYLDTTDILTRTGQHEVVASRTGRWGERMSQGMTHALLAGLGARLPGGRVTFNPPANPSAMQLLVTVDAFDAWPDGHCVLTAHWTVLQTSASASGLPNHRTFTSPAAASRQTGDAGVVAAMAAAVDQLAVLIARDLRGTDGV